MAGEKIKQKRQKKGLTQKQLGESCNPPINEANIRKYENGYLSPSLKTLRKIAIALNVPIYEIMEKEYWDTFSPDDISEDLRETAEGAKKAISDTANTIADLTHSAAALTAQQRKLLSHYENLNSIGQNKAVEQVEMLTKIPEYQKKPAAQILNAAHDNGATEEQKAHADKIMDDDSEWK